MPAATGKTRSHVQTHRIARDLDAVPHCNADASARNGDARQLSGGYGSICDFPRGLSVADADGTNSRNITPSTVAELLQQDSYGSTIGGPTGFDWSPSSNALVVSYHMILLDDDCSSARSIGGLYIVPLDESPGEQLADGPTRASAWSPSGRSIAYVTGEAFGQETEPPRYTFLI